MSNGDFEVMPIGTMVEVREIRKLTNELIALSEQHALPEEVLRKIQEMRVFYNWHVETYPVIV
jgi:recombinational DNA repair protein (RecF pathway)